MPLLVTPFYAGILAILFLVLSTRVILYRRDHRVSLGDGGDKALLKRMRTQANCAEYSGIGLLLLVIAELQGAPYWLIHAGGLLLVAGRLAHAVGFGSTPQIMPLRIGGMFLTLLSIALIALALIAYSFV